MFSEFARIDFKQSGFSSRKIDPTIEIALQHAGHKILH
jgi:hypothetical protein